MPSGRRNFIGAEKMTTLREHLIENMPISENCERRGIQPTLSCTWQKKLFEEGAADEAIAKSAELMQLTQTALNHPAVDTQAAAMFRIASRDYRRGRSMSSLVRRSKLFATGMERVTSALVAVLASAALAAGAFADTPKVTVTTDKAEYAHGEQGSITYSVDASSTGFDVIGLQINQNPYPVAIQQPLDGHDIFSSGTDTSGTYLDGFLQGLNVASINIVNDNQVIIARDSPPFTGIVDAKGKAITRYFTIDPNAQEGPYSVSVNEAWVTHRLGPGNYFDEPVASQDLIPANFEVKSPPVCVDGQGTFGVPGDGDGDGDIDLTDYRGFQHYMRGPGVDSEGCGDFDGDGNSDLYDFAVFQRRFSGDGVPAGS